MSKSVLLSLLIFFSNVSCAGQKSVDSLQRRILGLMEESDAVGVSVAVVKDNQLCYHKSFGYNPDFANLNKRDSIKNNDVFRIASISKTFVATAIMQLVERGLLNLDNDINQYLKFKVRNPYFPQTPITVRMLLNHHSSIADYQYWKYRNSLVMFMNDSAHVKTFFENFKPGTQYKYSNYGYSLLGAIIENVTQVRFDEFIENNILYPLGIDGGYNVSKIDSTRFVWARVYNQNTKKYSNSPRMFNPFTKEMKNYALGKSTALFSPAGGMKLSVPDLAKYMMTHINYGTYNKVRILTKESEEKLWTVYSNHYGLGFMHTNKKILGVDLIGHQGGAYGIHSMMFFNPEKKYGFIVICNGCNSGQALNTQILRELYHFYIH